MFRAPFPGEADGIFGGLGRAVGQIGGAMGGGGGGVPPDALSGIKFGAGQFPFMPKGAKPVRGPGGVAPEWAKPRDLGSNLPGTGSNIIDTAGAIGMGGGGVGRMGRGRGRALGRRLGPAVGGGNWGRGNGLKQSAMFDSIANMLRGGGRGMARPHVMPDAAERPPEQPIY